MDPGPTQPAPPDVRLAGWRTRLNRVCAAVLLLFLGWSIASEPVKRRALDVEAFDDYAIAREMSRRTLAAGSYDFQLAGEGKAVVYAYPPITLLLHRGLAATGERLGGLLWMVAIAAAAVAGTRALLALLGWRQRAERWIATLLAALAMRAFIQWDLHLLNSNSLCLGLALLSLAELPRDGCGRERPVRAGLWLAASIAVKPYAAALLPLLALGRRGRALAWAGLGAVVAHVVIPALLLGPAEAASLTASWLRLATRLADPEIGARLEIFSLALPSVLASLAETVSLPLGLEATRSTLLLCWSASLLWGLWPVLARATASPAGGIDGPMWVASAGILLLAPLPFSPLFQPHQAVALFPLALLIATRALEPRTPRAHRVIAVSIACLVFVVSSYAPAPGWLGLGTLLCFLLAVLATRILGPARSLNDVGPIRTRRPERPGSARLRRLRGLAGSIAFVLATSFVFQATNCATARLGPSAYENPLFVLGSFETSLAGLAQTRGRRGPRRIAYLGDSSVVAYSSPEHRPPAHLQRLLGTPGVRRRPIRVHVFAEPGMGIVSQYLFLDPILDLRPDLIVWQVSFHHLAPMWLRGNTRPQLAGFVATRRLPELLSLPLHEFGLSIDELLLYQGIVRGGQHRRWSRIVDQQLRLADARRASEGWLGEKLGRAAEARFTRVNGLATLGRARRGPSNRPRSEPDMARRTYAPVLEGLSSDHLVLRALAGGVRAIHQAGIPVIVYLNPVNVDDLEALGFEARRPLAEAADRFRRAVEAAGGHFVDLHDRFPDEWFRDAPGHFVEEPVGGAAREPSAVLAEALAGPILDALAHRGQE